MQLRILRPTVLLLAEDVVSVVPVLVSEGKLKPPPLFEFELHKLKKLQTYLVPSRFGRFCIEHKPRGVLASTSKPKQFVKYI